MSNKVKKMTDQPLKGKKIAILIDKGYEDLELHYPRLRLIEAGASVIVAAQDRDIRLGKWGYPIKPDAVFADLNADDYGAVIIPGGLNSPDKVRMDGSVMAFIRGLDAKGKTIAAICHGPWVLASAGVLKGRKATCYVAIKDDVNNAGGKYVDEEVVVDGNLISSRTPSDLPAFCKAIIAVLSGKGRHSKVQ